MADNTFILIPPLFFLLLSHSSFPLVSSAFLCGKNTTNTLLKIKIYFKNPPSLASWNSSTDCCTWENVGCQTYQGTIIYLNIYDTQVSGPIPKYFGAFPDLIDLYLTDNPGLSGPIPRFFSNLTALKTIHSTNSSLSGSLPSFLCKLPLLYDINFFHNHLTGPIPACLTSQFASINLGQNQLSGLIPPTLLQGATIFGGLIELDLNQNQLTGPIPKSLGNVDFYKIDLSGNKLTGDASFLFGWKKNVSVIDLSSNELDFNFSKVRLPRRKLYTLNLSHNRMTGGIPIQFSTRTWYSFDVSYNILCGEIPQGTLSTLNQSDFAHNKCLCGEPLPPCNQTTVGN